MVVKKEAKKQRYGLATMGEYISKQKNQDSDGKPLERKVKLTNALNAMLEGKKIVGNISLKGENYFILEAE